jgi:hypothetical protein
LYAQTSDWRHPQQFDLDAGFTIKAVVQLMQHSALGHGATELDRL